VAALSSTGSGTSSATALHHYAGLNWTMIEQLMRELGSMLPLTIKEAAFADPTLTLAGDGWSFSSPSAWRVIRGGVLDFGWSSAAGEGDGACEAA
jgi:hypothetical protein